MPAEAQPKIVRYGDGKPLDFTGSQNAEAHWLKFEGWIKRQKVTAVPDIVQHFLDTLGDEARVWAEGKTFDSKDKLKKLFFKKYSLIKSWQEGQTQWSNLCLRTGEGVDDLYVRLKRLAEHLNYTDAKTLKDKFLFALPPELRKEAYKGGDDILDCMTAAQDYLDITGLTSSMKEVTFNATERKYDRRDLTPYGRNRSRDHSRDRSRDRSLDKSRNGRTHNNSYTYGYSRTYNRSTSRDRGRSRERRSSYRKGSQSPRRSEERAKGTKCAKCKLLGHRWRDCPTLEEEMKKEMMREDF